MSHWNYRVVQIDGTDGPEYGIVEAYYDDNNKVIGHTDPMVFGDSIIDLGQALEWMMLSLEQPIIKNMMDEHEDINNAY